ncbi:hypothetical protein JD844_027595 [Phrynosoma platyrhinos]|uniref:DUF4097 domain-containing protein n=1 Tax=Phrynosoma platyrhinos TaxID=52577 RepID=A0ABQ7SGL0_PHRPL|nr:hypothetical protein JD844_027595 [Phrynosoma platyrhinos]
MLPLLPRCWQLAMGMATRRGLLKGEGVAGPLAAFSTSPGSQSQDPAKPGGDQYQPESSKALREWALAVSPFGLLKVRLPCHLTLGALDPHEHPRADRVLVAVKRPDTGPHHSSGPDGLQVEYNEALKEVTILSGGLESAASVAVRVPIKFDLDIKTSGNGSVKIEKIECDSCRIETERGASVLQSIKSVNIEKLQGSSVNISTENGLIKTKYLYAESSFLSSAAGDILLGNIHGDTTLQTKTGNITVDSADGSLKASTYQGEIDVYVVSQVGDVDLKSQNGAVTVKVPATLSADLQLSGSKVEVSPEIHCQDIQKVSREGHIMVTGKACLVS